MLHRRTNLGWILSFVGGVCLTVSSQSQDIPYRTGFEPPDFAVGALGTVGQDGWVGIGEIQDTNPAMIHSGAQSLQIDETSLVTREMASASGGKVYIDGYYHGPTVDSKPDPTSMSTGSSLLLFHATDGILALDGDGSGGGSWTVTGVSVSTTALQRITICQDYATHTWTLYIDKQQVPTGSPQTFGFKNSTLNQLSGIDIETSSHGKGYLDDFSATTSVPEFFQVSPFDFSKEWKNTTSSTPNWDLAGNDSQVGADDLLEFLSRYFEE